MQWEHCPEIIIFTEMDMKVVHVRISQFAKKRQRIVLELCDRIRIIILIYVFRNVISPELPGC